MAPRRRLHPLALFAALVLFSLACGRTELDTPTGVGGTGGATTGAAGTSGGRDGAAGVGTAGAGGASPVDGGTAGAGGARALPVPCGDTMCTPGTEACCLGSTPASSTCIDARAPCPGISVSCLDGAACGGGQVCCGSLLNASTACETPVACETRLGVPLCRSDAECTTSAPHCCLIGGTGVCRAQPLCP